VNRCRQRCRCLRGDGAALLVFPSQEAVPGRSRCLSAGLIGSIFWRRNDKKTTKKPKPSQNGPAAASPEVTDASERSHRGLVPLLCARPAAGPAPRGVRRQRCVVRGRPGSVRVSPGSNSSGERVVVRRLSWGLLFLRGDRPLPSWADGGPVALTSPASPVKLFIPSRGCPGHSAVSRSLQTRCVSVRRVPVPFLARSRRAGKAAG